MHFTTARLQAACRPFPGACAPIRSKNMDGNIEPAIEAVQAADKRLMDAIGVFDGIEIVQKNGRREQ